VVEIILLLLGESGVCRWVEDEQDVVYVGDWRTIRADGAAVERFAVH